MQIPLASNGLTDEQINDGIDVLRSGNLTMGERVKQFEIAMASYLGTKHFIMVNSGSSANLAMVEQMLRPSRGAPVLASGDKVLVPAIAWPTTVWPLLQLGLKPVFVDIDPETLALDLNHAEELVFNDRAIRGMFPIHPLGFGISGSKLACFASDNRLVLLSDVCESLGSFPEGSHAGLTGVASSFSFYFSHHITTMEGGGVATEVDDLADDLRSIRSHGWSRDRRDSDHWFGGLAVTDRKFTFVSAGYNIRPMEIQAAIGMSEVSQINSHVQRRREIARYVNQSVQGGNLCVVGGQHLEGFEEAAHSWMHLPIRTGETGLGKERLASYLENLGIETRPVLTGNFLDQPAAGRFLSEDQSAEQFTNANRVSSEVMLVGCHHSFSDGQVEFLAESLSRAGRLTR